jgi:hypothetical protein
VEAAQERHWQNPSGAYEPSVSHLRRPMGMDVKDWQTQLRRQFGRAQSFKLKNVGNEAVFSDFQVTNLQNGNRYRVAIRGANTGENFCACPDFATNDLRTCKHIEFVLGKLEKKRVGKAALARGFHPPYSEIYLLYGGERQVRFTVGDRSTVGQFAYLTARCAGCIMRFL